MVELTRTLPASWYCSSPLYQLERRAVFLKVSRYGWFYCKWKLSLSFSHGTWSDQSSDSWMWMKKSASRSPSNKSMLYEFLQPQNSQTMTTWKFMKPARYAYVWFWSICYRCVRILRFMDLGQPTTKPCHSNRTCICGIKLICTHVPRVLPRPWEAPRQSRLHKASLET